MNSSESVSGSASLLAPVAPHDDLSFEELGRRYNYNQTSARCRTLAWLVVQESCRCQRPLRVLDIGAGYGIGDNRPEAVMLLQAVRDQVDELWGVEPDPTVRPAHAIFDQRRRATMEAADLPAGYFDIAFSCFVMEHVEDPKSFLAAVHRCLKPGGRYLFLTPNARHYFTRAARALKSIGMDERVLRLIRGSHVHDYHYPVQYRCNSPRVIDRLATETGFLRPEYAYTETGGPRPYFPGPLLPIYWALVAKRLIFRRSDHLLELFCRMTKPSHS